VDNQAHFTPSSELAYDPWLHFRPFLVLNLQGVSVFYLKMSNLCVLPEGDFPLSSIINVVFSCFFLVFIAIASAIGRIEPTADPDKPPRFVVNTMVVWQYSMAGLLYCISNPVLFWYFSQAKDHGSSQKEQVFDEIACTLAGSVSFFDFLAPVFISLVLLGMFYVSAVSSPAAIEQVSKDVALSENETSVVVFPAYRGQQGLALTRASGPLERTFYFCDEFDSVHCTQADHKWLRTNVNRSLRLAIEPKPRIQLVNCALSQGELDLPLGSIDVIMVRAFMRMTHINRPGRTDEVCAKLSLNLLNRCYHLLRPGGRLVCLEINFTIDAFKLLLSQSNFAKCDLQQSSQNYPISLAKVSLLTVSKRMDMDSIDIDATTQSIDMYTSTSTTMPNVVNDREGVARASPLPKPGVIYGLQLSWLFISCLLFVVLLYVTPLAWPALRWPRRLNYHSRINSSLLSALGTLPMSTYISWFHLADALEAQISTSSSTSSSSSCTCGVALVLPKLIVRTLLTLTVFQLITSIPSLVIAYFLEDTMDEKLYQYVSLFLTFLFYYGLKRFIDWYVLTLVCIHTYMHTCIRYIKRAANAAALSITAPSRDTSSIAPEHEALLRESQRIQ
jgi:hypothetical protein